MARIAATQARAWSARRVLRAVTTVLPVFALADCANAAPEIDRLVLPPGFTLDVYSDAVPGARSLALSPSGVLYVGTLSAGNVYAVADRDGDRHAETVYLIARGLNMPNGVAFRHGALYVAEVDRILRFDDIERALEQPPAPVVVYADLPGERHHGWKYIAFGPDDHLYVPVGAPCNICDPPPPFASILRLTPDGGRVETYARGVRNSVGFDWQPQTGELWFTDNGRDMLGDDSPSCELNRAPRSGMHFGYPYVHGADLLDPEFGAGHRAADYVPPALALGPHVAPLGIEFYAGDMFPPDYRGSLFIALHGSWNRSEKSGYRVMRVSFDAGGGPATYEPFIDGWLQGQQAWGRPVDLETLADGSLLVSDDTQGVIYRISYARRGRDTP